MVKDSQSLRSSFTLQGTAVRLAPLQWPVWKVEPLAHPALSGALGTIDEVFVPAPVDRWITWAESVATQDDRLVVRGEDAWRQPKVDPPLPPVQPVDGRDGYDATAARQELLTAVTRLNLNAEWPLGHDEDIRTVAAFVNYWGCLDGGGKSADAMTAQKRSPTQDPGFANRPTFDGVTWTILSLRHVQELAEAVRKREWQSVNLALQETAPAIRVAVHSEPKKGARPALVWEAKTLLDVLYVAIWEWATGGDRIRYCPECRGLFATGRAGKTYCSRRCVSYAGVKRWRKKQKRTRTKTRRSGR